MQAEYGDRALIGGGTLLSVRAVEELHGAGGRIMVTPNTDMQVIARGAELGLELLPGFMTPSEAFAAIQAGARRIKLFPAARLGPAYVKALKDVLRSAEHTSELQSLMRSSYAVFCLKKKTK